MVEKVDKDLDFEGREFWYVAEVDFDSDLEVNYITIMECQEYIEGKEIDVSLSDERGLTEAIEEDAEKQAQEQYGEE